MFDFIHAFARRLPCIAIAGSTCIALAPGAIAAGTCNGTLATSLLHPMPVPVTVALQTSVDDSVNPMLTRRFVEGMRRAGVTMSPQGNMTLNMAVAIASDASAPAGPISGTYRGFDWVSGEQAPQGRANIRSANLTLSVTLSDNVQFTQSWVATAKCIVQTDDSGALAEDIGELIGRNIGQNFDSRRM